MQLGLRFAAAKLPGLRTGRGSQKPPRSQAEPWWPEEPNVGPGLSYLQTADPLYNKERQRSGAIAPRCSPAEQGCISPRQIANEGAELTLRQGKCRANIRMVPGIGWLAVGIMAPAKLSTE